MNNANFYRIRRVIQVVILVLLICFSSGGCALFHSKTENKETEAEKNAFEQVREDQGDLSEFVASAGRKDSKKKKVDPGQTFLLSDTAKEIYANTER